MSVTRIGEVHVKEELNEALGGFLISLMLMIKSSKGYESVQLHQSQDDPTKFIMTEVWDSVESHPASSRTSRLNS